MKIEHLKKIRLQLLVSFSLLIALFFGLAIFVMFSHFRVEREYDKIINRMLLEYQITDTFSDMIDSYVSLLSNTNNQDLFDSYTLSNENLEQVFMVLDSQIVSSESLNAYNNVKNMVRSVKEECDIGLSNVKEKSFSGGSGIYDRAINGRNYVEENTARLLLSELEYSKILQEQLYSIKRTTLVTTIFLTLFVTVLCIFFAFGFAERISRPLVKLAKIADHITRGHLKAKVDQSLLKRSDETGALSKSFDNMLNRLNVEIETQKKFSADLKRSKTKIEEYSHDMEREKVKLEALLSSLGEGVVAIDLHGNILIFNEQAENMFGKTFQQSYGKNFVQFFELLNDKGERITMDNYPINTSVTTQKPVISKLHLKKDDTTILPLSNTMSPVIFQNEMIGMVGTFRDITEDEKVDSAKSEFVSLASHQLQTPLTAIRWFLEILLDKEKLNKRQVDYVKKSLVSTHRMIALVDDFLNVSRLESGMISISPQDGDFVKFVEELVEETSVIARKKHQKIVFKSKQKKIKASFDSNMVGQILLNLFSNAIQYSPENQTIYVSLSKVGDRLRVEVSDNGLGIPHDDRKKLFTKFFRTKQSSRVSTNGSGLGLYIVKKILDTIGGRIKCESVLHRGSTFIVDMPVDCVKIEGGKKLIQKDITL